MFTRVSGSGSGRERTESGRRLGAGIYQTGLFVMQQNSLKSLTETDLTRPPGTEQTTGFGCQRSVSRINEGQRRIPRAWSCAVCRLYDEQCKNNATIIGEIKAFGENISIYLVLNWFSEFVFCLISADRICYWMLLFDQKRSRPVWLTRQKNDCWLTF